MVFRVLPIRASCNSNPRKVEPSLDVFLPGRTWNLLRLALLWVRKGGIFKRGLIANLRLLPKYIKSLRTAAHDSIHYAERELSFDETPIFHFKMHRPASMRFHMPRIPCVNRHVDFDFNGDDVSKDDGRRSFLRDDEREDYKIGAGGDDGHNYEMVPCEEEGIDLRAEDFITKFYEQMKLQRQISNLQYNEMLSRGTS
ncbi:hypothetical protein HHK36_012304 [Tetracentron sinense]|uniref:Cotton fiber protein n=1 Tax=Tetracentron sinense TaxID=13715 RepID=A0A835DFE3_TETSI|nr:hypothetical protein HHK36_012304 [Tetracentron sinense]